MDRDEYVAKPKAQLDARNAELAKRKQKAKKAQAGMRVGHEPRVEYFRRQRDEARERLRGLREAVEETWRELARAADEVREKVREAFEKVRPHLRTP
jgi:hypothetical protein